MHRYLSIIISLFIIAGAPLNADPIGGQVVLNKDTGGKWWMLVDGKPFFIKGVGRMDHPELARACGVNTIRRYNSRDVADTLNELEAAKARHVKIIRGISVGRESATFSYGNPDQVKAQRERIRKIVQTFRDHPALLCWGLGNESERITAPGKDTEYWRELYWKELNVLAGIVKQEDPAHPVINVIAGNSPRKIAMMKKFAPAIDIIGINSYAAAVLTSARLDQAKWDKPFILTEFGPRGHWEVPRTRWRVPVEPSSEAKADNYVRAYRAVADDLRCLGTVCFVWSDKQEITGTWYGMFLQSGEKTPAVDRLSLLYTGKPLSNLSPVIKKLSSKLDQAYVIPGKGFSAEIVAEDNENDPLTYEWKVIRESGVKWAVGDYEPIPPTIAGCILPPGNTARIELRTPEVPGAYRLFVYVRDGKGGGAVQNMPFMVRSCQN